MTMFSQSAVSPRNSFTATLGSKAVKNFFESYFIFLSLLLLVLFFSLATDNFFSMPTLNAILAKLPTLTVITIGMTLVLICGGIDLSVGSVVGLSSGVIGLASTVLGLPLWLAALLGITAGTCAGLVNGFLGSYLRLPIFIVTLGMLEVARGLAEISTGSKTLFLGPDILQLSYPIPGIGLSPSFLLALALVVVAQFTLTRTVFGRRIIAIGTNEEAARISGIRTKPYILAVLVISGALAGLGGLMDAAYLGSSNPSAATGWELSAIAAAVIGGTSLMGGRGSILGAFIGVLIIAVLDNGLAQMDVSPPGKRLITGAVIILAVFVDRFRNR